MSPASRHFAPNAQQFSVNPVPRDPILGVLALSGECVGMLKTIHWWLVCAPRSVVFG